MKVFIIILNWNRAQDTIDCLKSVSGLRTEGWELSVLVVDNASIDDSVKKIKNAKINIEFEVIENKRNLGFAGGNNVGIKYALKNGADYILLLNNDTYLDENLLVCLIKAVGKHKDGGAFSPKIYFAKGYEFHKNRYRKSELGKVIWAAGGNIDWDNVYGKNRGVDEVDRGQYDKLQKVDFATGACVLYRPEALRKAGVFDPRYFMYLEDVELGVRMARRGWGTYYVPEAILWHKVAQSSGVGSRLNDYFITRNRMVFGMKYASLRAKFALLREALRFLVSGRTWQRNGIIDYFIENLYEGSWKNEG